MPTYVYAGRDVGGAPKSGEIEAPDQATAKERLRAQSLTLNKLEAKTTAKALSEKKGFGFSLGFGGGVKTKDLVVFTRQFATMVDAGLPLVQSLELLAGQEANPTLRNTILSVKQTVEGGKTLSEALGRHPKVFNRLFVNLVAAGEAAGVLDDILARLSAYIEKNMKLVKQVKGAMVYPMLVVGVATVVTLALLIFVIPVFQKMFADMGAALPAPTQLVVDLSEWIRGNVWFLLGGGVAAFVALKQFLRSPRGIELRDRAALRAPIVGPLVRKVAVAKFTRTLGTMLASGVNILEALDIVAATAGNVVIERGLLWVRHKISEGRPMAALLSELNLFPPMVVQMIGVGESTGAMDAMLNKIADFYDDEVDQAVKTMMSALEPLIMAFLAVILGGLVISMYLPVFSMAGNMGSN
jgi:type IV pilus assembly protein PilC